MSDQARHGLGDPRLAWVVLLDLTWTAPPPASVLAERLRTLAEEAGWHPPGEGAVTLGERADLLCNLATGSPEPLRVGRYDDGVVLAARHDLLDGLAMLAASRRLLGEVRSSARGLGRQERRSGTGALGRRAAEVLFRPTARVADSRSSSAGGDAFASTTVVGAPRTADLVLAGARGVSDWNSEHGLPSRRVSVAVGASTTGGDADDLRDASAFLRLTGVEQMGAGDVRAALSAGRVQPGGGTGPGGAVVGRLAAVAVRIAAPRLGSTLLVSHLGALQADDRLGAAAFYPVTGGGSGLSLGAATLNGRTTLTLRGRAAQHDDDALQQLLERVVARLD